jgi:hypothetical protein
MNGVFASYQQEVNSKYQLKEVLQDSGVTEELFVLMQKISTISSLCINSLSKSLDQISLFLTTINSCVSILKLPEKAFNASYDFVKNSCERNYKKIMYSTVSFARFYFSVLEISSIAKTIKGIDASKLNLEISSKASKVLQIFLLTVGLIEAKLEFNEASENYSSSLNAAPIDVKDVQENVAVCCINELKINRFKLLYRNEFLNIVGTIFDACSFTFDLFEHQKLSQFFSIAQTITSLTRAVLSTVTISKEKLMEIEYACFNQLYLEKNSQLNDNLSVMESANNKLSDKLSEFSRENQKLNSRLCELENSNLEVKATFVLDN